MRPRSIAYGLLDPSPAPFGTENFTERHVRVPLLRTPTSTRRPPSFGIVDGFSTALSARSQNEYTARTPAHVVARVPIPRER